MSKVKSTSSLKMGRGDRRPVVQYNFRRGGQEAAGTGRGVSHFGESPTKYPDIVVPQNGSIKKAEGQSEANG